MAKIFYIIGPRMQWGHRFFGRELKRDQCDRIRSHHRDEFGHTTLGTWAVWPDVCNIWKFLTLIIAQKHNNCQSRLKKFHNEKLTLKKLPINDV